MALTPSLDLPLGTLAPAFRLQDTSGAWVSLDATAPATLVLFICNHCPYVKHLKAPLAALCRDYLAAGLKTYAIMPNDVTRYPLDHPDLMRADHAAFGYSFPYLYDESQAVARAYGAQCTPEFYLFGPDLRLRYHGQMDDSRPGNALPIDGRDLRAAIAAVLAGEEVLAPQKPSIGCNIKWK